VRAEVLRSLLETPSPAGADEGSRRVWFQRLCELEREQGGLEAAMATALRAARELPREAALWDQAEELARALARPEGMAALYEEVLSPALPREETLILGERAVRFHEEWFEDSAGVVRVLDRVLEVDPTADWAFDRLKLLLDAAERWDDLFALYDRALKAATGPQRVALLEDAAQTAKDFADRPDRAIPYLEQLAKLRPEDATLTAALERLYERQGRYRELIDLLAARLPDLRGDEARRARARVAALWLDELANPDAALEALEPILDHAAQTAGAPVDPWPLLERILAASPLAAAAERRSSIPATGDADRSPPAPSASERSSRRRRPPRRSASARRAGCASTTRAQAATKS
jgi:tetratricopeptide (TPR) repeat protein